MISFNANRCWYVLNKFLTISVFNLHYISTGGQAASHPVGECCILFLCLYNIYLVFIFYWLIRQNIILYCLNWFYLFLQITQFHIYVKRFFFFFFFELEKLEKKENSSNSSVCVCVYEFSIYFLFEFQNN